MAVKRQGHSPKTAVRARKFYAAVLGGRLGDRRKPPSVPGRTSTHGFRSRGDLGPGKLGGCKGGHESVFQAWLGAKPSSVPGAVLKRLPGDPGGQYNREASATNDGTGLAQRVTNPGVAAKCNCGFRFKHPRGRGQTVRQGPAAVKRELIGFKD